MSGRAGTSPHRTGSRGGSGRGRRDRPTAPGDSLRKRHLLPDGAVAGTRHVSPRGCGPRRASPRWLTRVLGRSAAGGAPAQTARPDFRRSGQQALGPALVYMVTRSPLLLQVWGQVAHLLPVGSRLSCLQSSKGLGPHSKERPDLWAGPRTASLDTCAQD